MKLVSFHYAGPNETLIFINPEHVVAVRRFPNTTHIYVSALQNHGGPSYYPVRETIDDVVKRLIS
ncbi:hypothetical protein HJB93_06055 [Rhizobium sp. NLR12b]|uniref:hypothetical protein n=1 Tax=Rhizobium sp. NLR12b TaxID=2731108 RepID=UPI001C83C388|nr:hypothetical protein [Rhizobium sp. NLR12b]MBX5298812.1 hypothetical protein [Rhizobium sp. NLR12b]